MLTALWVVSQSVHHFGSEISIIIRWIDIFIDIDLAKMNLTDLSDTLTFLLILTV